MSTRGKNKKLNSLKLLNQCPIKYGAEKSKFTGGKAYENQRILKRVLWHIFKKIRQVISMLKEVFNPMF